MGFYQGKTVEEAFGKATGRNKQPFNEITQCDRILRRYLDHLGRIARLERAIDRVRQELDDMRRQRPAHISEIAWQGFVATASVFLGHLGTLKRLQNARNIEAVNASDYATLIPLISAFRAGAREARALGKLDGTIANYIQAIEEAEEIAVSLQQEGQNILREYRQAGCP